MNVEQGKVVEVTITYAQAEVTSAAIVGATTIFVDDVSDFDENGGSVQIGALVYAYTTITDLDDTTIVDEPANSITLTTGLTVALESGDKVFLYPLVDEKYATVVSPAADDSLRCRVPQSLQPLFVDGVREEYDQESVWIELDPGRGWYIKDVASAMKVQGSVVSPVGLPVGTDGLPPANTPTVVARGGIRSVTVTLDPIANADPVVYEYHISTTAGFTATAGNVATMVHTGPETGFVIRALANGTDLAAGITYYMRVFPKDVDGYGPVSAEVSAAPIQVTGPDIAANAVDTDQLNANAVTAGKLDALIALLGAITVGANIRINPYEGIVIDSPAGQTKLAPDGTGNSFAGQGTFDAMTVLGNLGIYGATNFLSGTMALSSGVNNPTAMPLITSSYDTADTGSDRFNPRGLTQDGAGNWVITDNLAGNTGQFQFWNPGGFPGGAVNVVAGYETWGGIVRIGAYYYILACPIGTAGIGSAYKILKYDTATNTYQFMSATVLTGSAARPAIGTDGTNILMAYQGAAGNQLNIRVFDPSFTSGGAPTILFARAAAAGLWGSTDVTAVNGVLVGGVMKHFASSVNIHVGYDLTSSTVITRNATIEWPAAAPGAIYGVYHDGTVFSMNSKRRFYKYTNLSGQYDFAYSWYDSDAGGTGTAETKVSPIRATSPTKFAKWTVTLPTAPPDDGTTDGANTGIIYASVHGATLIQQTVLTEPALAATYSTLLASGTAPQSTNQFSARPGAIGSISSSAVDANGDPKIKLQGDGTILLGGIVKRIGSQVITTTAAAVASAVSQNAGSVAVFIKAGRTYRATFYGNFTPGTTGQYSTMELKYGVSASTGGTVFGAVFTDYRLAGRTCGTSLVGEFVCLADSNVNIVAVATGQGGTLARNTCQGFACSLVVDEIA